MRHPAWANQDEKLLCIMRRRCCEYTRAFERTRTTTRPHCKVRGAGAASLAQRLDGNTWRQTRHAHGGGPSRPPPDIKLAPTLTRSDPGRTSFTEAEGGAGFAAARTRAGLTLPFFPHAPRCLRKNVTDTRHSGACIPRSHTKPPQGPMSASCYTTLAMTG